MGIVLAAALSLPTPSVHAGGSLPPASSLPTIAHALSVPSAFPYCRHHPRIDVNATVRGFHLNIPRFIFYGKEGALFGSNEVPIKAVVAGSRAVSYGGMHTIIPLDSTVAMLPDFSWTQLQGILHCGDSHRFGTYMEVYGLLPVTPPPIERIHTNPAVLDATQAEGICRRYPTGRVRVRVRGMFTANPTLFYPIAGRIGQLPVVSSARNLRGQSIIPDGIMVTVHGLLACRPAPPTLEAYWWQR